MMGGMEPAPDHDGLTLKDWIDRRRAELDLTIAEVASAASLTEEGLRRITNGTVKQPRASTVRRLEAALRWANGSLADINSGGEPTPLDPPQPAGTPTINELIEQLVDLTDTPEEAYDLLTQALLRRRRSSHDTASDEHEAAG